MQAAPETAGTSPASTWLSPFRRHPRQPVQQLGVARRVGPERDQPACLGDQGVPLHQLGVEPGRGELRPRHQAVGDRAVTRVQLVELEDHRAVVQQGRDLGQPGRVQLQLLLGYEHPQARGEFGPLARVPAQGAFGLGEQRSRPHLRVALALGDVEPPDPLGPVLAQPALRLRPAYPGRGQLGVLDRAQRLAVDADLVGDAPQPGCEQPVDAPARGEPLPQLADAGEEPLRLGHQRGRGGDTMPAEDAGEFGERALELTGRPDVVGPHRGPVRVGQQPPEPVGPRALAPVQPRHRVPQPFQQLGYEAGPLCAYGIGVDAGHLQARRAVGGRVPVGSRSSCGLRGGQVRDVRQRAQRGRPVRGREARGEVEQRRELVRGQRRRFGRGHRVGDAAVGGGPLPQPGPDVGGRELDIVDPVRRGLVLGDRPQAAQGGRQVPLGLLEAAGEPLDAGRLGGLVQGGGPVGELTRGEL
nr:hypothetical protein GCM10020092_095850 [Actinoplanes digitatis]